MKLVLCTLAICLSILASVFTTKELIRAEGKKIRASLPKVSSESAEATGRPEALVQKLESISAQLDTLSRRLSSLESTVARQNLAPSARPTAGDSPASAKSAAASATTLARLDAVSVYLADLTTFLDQSFEHLEKTVTETAATKNLAETLEPLSKKMDAIDSYFTPLYAFLGLVYDPASNDRLADYPSVDLRINELFLQLEALRKDVSTIRQQVTPRATPY
jgi:hypothetical protein